MDSSSPDLGRPGGPGDGPAPASGQPAGPSPAASGSASFFDAIRRSGLYRSDDRWIGGVAGGLGARFGIDPLLVRAIFAISSLLGGLGLIAYGVGWALLPEARDGRIHLEQTIRGQFDVGLLGAIAFVLVGLGRGDSWSVWGHPSPGWLIGVSWAVACAVTVVVVLIVVAARRPGGATPPRWSSSASSAATSIPSEGPRTMPYSTASTAPSVDPRSTPGYAYGTMPPVPPVPPVPKAPKDRVRGPGTPLTGATVALALLALAGLLAASRLGTFDGPVLLTAACVAIVLCGLAIIVAGLRGRSSGMLGFLAIVGIVLTIPAAATLHDEWVWGGWSGAVTDETFVPQTREEAGTGYSMGVGDATIDLREVPLERGTLNVPIQLGVGDLTVVVPHDAAVGANVQSGVGEVRWEVDDSNARSSGVGGGTRSFRSEEVGEGTTPNLQLDVSVGAGSVTIKEAR